MEKNNPPQKNLQRLPTPRIHLCSIFEMKTLNKWRTGKWLPGVGEGVEVGWEESFRGWNGLAPRPR